MKNTFKDNSSRFSILNENNDDNSKKSKENTRNKPQKKTDKERFSNLNENNSNSLNLKETENKLTYSKTSVYISNSSRNDRINMFNHDPQKEKEKLAELKKEQIKKDLDINNFPEFITSKKTTTTTNLNDTVVLKSTTNNPSFLDKTKIGKINVKKDDILLPGVVYIRFKEDRKIEYKYRESNNNDKIYPNLVLKKLSDNNERWKQNYIQCWGEDEYEKMYKFPNYDYDYFDNLDDQYEIELEELEKQESDYEDED